MLIDSLPRQWRVEYPGEIHYVMSPWGPAGRPLARRGGGAKKRKEKPNDETKQVFDNGRWLSRRHRDTEMNENAIGALVVDGAVEPHRDLGPGLLGTVGEVTFGEASVQTQSRGLSTGIWIRILRASVPR